MWTVAGYSKMRLPNLLEHDTLHEVSKWKIGFSSLGFLLNEDTDPNLGFFLNANAIITFLQRKTPSSNALSMTPLFLLQMTSQVKLTIFWGMSL